MAMSSYSWNAIGNIPVSELTDPRLQLHWAAQIVAAFGNTVIHPRADDSQSNLGWVESLSALCSHPSPDGASVGLRLADLTLVFLGTGQTIASEFRLARYTLQQGLDWLATTYATHSKGNAKQSFEIREYEMPPHPVGQNVPFSLKDQAPFQEYQHWYANAHLVLTSLSENWPGASPVRCWPHHFDIATLVILDPEKGAEDARSVGCGMSPGDGTYSEPYWYVNFWPYPDKDQLPDIPLGHWHTEGWIGGILTATEMVGSGVVESQSQTVQKFFDETTKIGFSLLGKTPG